MATTIEKILGGGSPSGTGRIPGGGQNAVQRKGLDLEKMEGVGIRKVPLPVTQVTAGNNAGNAPKQPERLSYVDLYKKLNPDPGDEKTLEKRKKQRRRDGLFAAISDGISALSNLYFTTQYAPNMYDGRNTASEQVNKRWENLAKRLEESRRACRDGLMKAQEADDEYNEKERAWRRQLGLDKIKQERDAAADARAEEEQKWKRELHPLAVREAEGKAKAAESQAKYADDYEASKVERNKASAGASRASASASYARADDIRTGGSRYHGRFRGKDYRTSADYEKAVMDAVQAYGDIDLYETLERDYWGNPTKRRNKSIAELAAEVEERDKNGLGWGLGNNNETDW